MRNKEVARLLEDIADVLEVKGDTPFRVRAYREAARRIEGLTESVESLVSSSHLQDVPGVGESIAGKIKEYLEDGHSEYFAEISKGIPPGLVQLLQVPGLGPSKARLIFRELGVSSAEELERAAREHRISKLSGMGEKSEANILREVERWRQRTRRLLLGTALPAAEEIASQMEGHPAVKLISPAGSIRRMKETIGDIDVLVASDEPLKVMDYFVGLPVVKEVIAKGPTKSSILTSADLQIDLRVVEPSAYGAALQYFTGSKSHNIALRDIAIKKGYKLSEYGLFDETTGKSLAGQREEDVYAALGLPWIPPELRENQGEIEAAVRNSLPHLIDMSDIRGDLHVHTKRSDGTASLEEMVEAARARGLQYIAVCDHSRSLGVAGGLSLDEVAQEQADIRRLNEEVKPFRILSGIEMEILADGSLDYPDEVLAGFDIVTVSVHSAFGQPKEKITGRIARAIRNSYVDVLNHPTGRLIDRRDPYEVDIEAIFDVATQTGTSFEINSSPDRLDLDDSSARRARQRGLMLAINTDAHAPGHLSNIRYGVATARRGWVEPDGVLNAQPLDGLISILKSRERGAV